MNERNVAALASLLTEYIKGVDEFRAKASYVPTTAEQEGRMAAEFVIARGGVLVPSALTDDDCDYIGATQYEDARDTVEMRAVLERVARGETP
jgi:hypothetical protein